MGIESAQFGTQRVRDSARTNSPAAASLRTPHGKLTFCHFTTVHKTIKSRSFHRICVPLADAGFDVRLVSPATIRGSHNGVKMIPINSPNRLGEFGASARLTSTLFQQQADLYHFQDPQLIPLALLLKIVFRKNIIYDAYEDFPSMVQNKLSWPVVVRSVFAMMTASLESCAALSFDGITTADPITMRRFARVGRSRKLVFYNFPNLDFFPLGNARKNFDLVYRGGLSERAGTFVLLDALHLLARQGRSVRLLLQGYADGATGERELRDRICALNLSDLVEIRSRIPHEEMAATLSQARIGISPLQSIPKFQKNLPVKIFEYWASALPVIASDLPPARPFFQNSSAGLLFPPGDVNTLAELIARLLDHPDEAIRMGQRGRLLVEQRLNNSSEARKLLGFCARLARTSSTAGEIEAAEYA